MKTAAVATILLCCAATALAAPKGLRVPGGEPRPFAFTVTDLEIEPPAKRTDGAATAKVTLTPVRPSAQLREMEVRLVYDDRGFGGSGRFRRDAPQPRDLPKGSVRYVAYPETARIGCIDPLQARQVVVVEFDEGGRHLSELHVLPFTWLDQYPTLDGRCHIPKSYGERPAARAVVAGAGRGALERRGDADRGVKRDRLAILGTGNR